MELKRSYKELKKLFNKFDKCENKKYSYDELVKWFTKIYKDDDEDEIEIMIDEIMKDIDGQEIKYKGIIQQ